MGGNGKWSIVRGLLDQSEWEVDSALLDESVDDGQEDEPAYPEFLDPVIGNNNIDN